VCKLKKLIKKVMFHSRLNKINKNKELLDIPEGQISLSLSKDEIAILLQSIKNSNFSGSVLEELYNLVYKLQTSYNKLK
jgi:hypothetical protein